MQVGISKKVSWPSALLLVVGAVLAIVGALTGDTTLTTSGVTLVGGSAVTFGIGYHAPTGEVVVEPGDASDDLLSEEVLKELKNS